ncbi:MAG: bifunctional (p)ppGpp synthetase/guanosine-3',5'-bis(diphosphate) 3'-pyrophosphohydrolase [Variibacter sp.]|nr:bifunctional (p)ppGpp synthetase/guanosine-3',5'-bis(diphosphate) 3'-pyrophosphohydrolase [Variibacter sp.]
MSADGAVAPSVDQLFAELTDKVKASRPQEDLAPLERAYQFALRHHAQQTRVSGEPYMTHPLNVALILASMNMDLVCLQTGLLHDVIEDTGTTHEDLRREFGEEVAHCVDGVTKLGKVKFYSPEERQAESVRKMLLAMVSDIRVILVKLADRLHNMRTLGPLSAERQHRIARETLEIYAPIAHRLGMGKIRGELEDLAFHALEPEVYADTSEQIATRIQDSEAALNQMKQTLTVKLARENIPAALEGRIKRVYSVIQKLRRQKIGIDQVYDLLALRIITDSVKNCYAALGVIHNEWHPIPGRIKDFIAIPRPNLYQSLHTSVIGPGGVNFEIQIRTEEMHRIAEEGIAAHWKYKEGRRGSGVDDQRVAWLRQLVEWQREMRDPGEFMSTLKVDLYPEEVYCFTPRGRVIILPREATPIDFAYAVHTDVGNRCVAAKVDRRLVPLRTPLRNGQTVEIITAKGATPNPAWVNFVVTAKARASIRQYLKNLKRSEAIDLGKRLLNQALEEFSLTLRKVPQESIAAVVAELGLKTQDELLERIGLGERVAPFIARRLLPADSEAVAEGTAGPLAIAGTEGLVVAYARCCFPIPNDPILASLSSGRGVVIHREACGNLASFRKQPEKWIPVTWQAATDRLFHVEIRADVTNRMGVLASVASAIAGTQTNIDRVALVERDTDTSTLIFELLVHDRKQLASVMRAVRSMPEVLRVARTLA